MIRNTNQTVRKTSLIKRSLIVAEISSSVISLQFEINGLFTKEVFCVLKGVLK